MGPFIWAATMPEGTNLWRGSAPDCAPVHKNAFASRNVRNLWNCFQNFFGISICILKTKCMCISICIQIRICIPISKWSVIVRIIQLESFNLFSRNCFVYCSDCRWKIPTSFCPLTTENSHPRKILRAQDSRPLSHINPLQILLCPPSSHPTENSPHPRSLQRFVNFSIYMK